MPYGTNDLACMFADFGEVVSFGAYTTRATLSFETDPQDMGGQMSVLGQTISFTFATAALPGLKKASAVTVAGVSYKVLQVHKKGDGALSTAYLEVA